MHYATRPAQGSLPRRGFRHSWQPALLLGLLAALPARGQVIGNHRAVYNANGILQPWTPWRDALEREVNWYLRCPVEHGYPEFQAPRDELWAWIQRFQLPNLAQDGRLWVNFFEDHSEPTNRTAWAPLNLARFLIERQDALDPDWQRDARALIEFVNRNFVRPCNGIAYCGEQDGDQHPWGGVATTYGAVLALYTRATGSLEYKALAHQTLTWALYGINDDGCPYDGVWKGAGRGG